MDKLTVSGEKTNLYCPDQQKCMRIFNTKFLQGRIEHTRNMLMSEI